MSLALEGVRKEYGDVVAVEELSLSVDEGQFHCLIGPNGSGKTTVFRMLLGLTRPTAGHVAEPAGLVGCGFQEPNFYPGLTVRENLDVFTGLVDAPGEAWRETILTELRLRRALDRRAGDLSGGFARKLDLALALLKRPDYLLLDEPLAALDDVSKERLLAFLEAYAADGNALLVSTHHVADFEPYVDRVTIMHDGGVVLDRDADDVDVGGSETLQEYYVDRVLEREGIDAAGEHRRPPSTD